MDLIKYKEELLQELDSILQYWATDMPDELHGGFYGRIDGDNMLDRSAPKGGVLNARILWAFSAASRRSRDPRWIAVARAAYDYFRDHFIDKQYGGTFWNLDHMGKVLSDRKQIYGQAFSIYGLSEYFLACGDNDALQEAVHIFKLIEKYSYDPVYKGYFEAFAGNWGPLDDLRLSDKDANEKKTMNTHLHVLEAYSNLYRAWPDELLGERIQELLDVFVEHIINPKSGHLGLFFTEDWQSRSDLISYGHDIEAAWLLQEAAETIKDADRMARSRDLAGKMANAAAKGLDDDGGLWYEYEPSGGFSEGLVREKHWWPQAEAMVGFFNAWQVSGNQLWLDRSVRSWNFVKEYIKDPQYGEWFWGVLSDHRPMPGQDKAGFWKCPYHNSRACLEIIRRIGC